MKKIVIALGGNALLRKGQKVSVETQEENVQRALRKLLVIFKNNKVVITHGNGPQVGYLLLQQNTPLDVIDAETEGQIGYLIQQNLQNLLWKNNIKKSIVSMITQVLVDSQDDAFKEPSKFVGPFYSKNQALRLDKKFNIKKDSNRGYRRVVASPKPIKIIEDKTIINLLKQNTIVIAAGGGGIPVVISNKGFKGVEAVVDKDRSSAVMGNAVNANELIMITDVQYACLNFGTKNEVKLKRVKLKDIQKYYLDGHFDEGSMGPKIESGISFLNNGGKRVLITSIDNIGKGGTIITK